MNERVEDVWLDYSSLGHSELSNSLVLPFYNQTYDWP